MKRALLKELGLDGAAIAQIMSEHGKDIEKYKRQLMNLQAQSIQQQAAYEQQIQAIKFKMALDTELRKTNVIDAELIGVKLDRTKIRLNEDGSLSGLTEQVESLRVSHSFLFRKGQSKPTICGWANCLLSPQEIIMLRWDRL